MDFIKNHKRFFIITASFLCVLLMIGTYLYREKPTVFENTIGFVLIPIEKSITKTKTFFADKIKFYSNINKIENDNRELSEEIIKLREEMKRLELVDKDNKVLSALLELDQRYPDYSKTGAFVVAMDVSNWYDIFLIDKGTDSGLEKNMVVLAEGGLVGKIIESGKKYSKVVSIIDDSTNVAAAVLRTGDLGIVRGDMKLMFDGLCIMENIDINATIVEKDEIVTSHFSKIYPPGLTIGYVREVRTDVKGLSKYAIIEPTVKFKDLDTVLIINKLFEKKVEGLLDLEEN